MPNEHVFSHPDGGGVKPRRGAKLLVLVLVLLLLQRLQLLQLLQLRDHRRGHALLQRLLLKCLLLQCLLMQHLLMQHLLRHPLRPNVHVRVGTYVSGDAARLPEPLGRRHANLVRPLLLRVAQLVRCG